MAISRNRADYSKATQQHIHANAVVFFGGDEDVAWGKFFEERERLEHVDFRAPQDKATHIQLKVTPPKSQ